jgi:hypothetical protein
VGRYPKRWLGKLDRISQGMQMICWDREQLSRRYWRRPRPEGTSSILCNLQRTNAVKIHNLKKHQKNHCLFHCEQRGETKCSGTQSLNKTTKTAEDGLQLHKKNTQHILEFGLTNTTRLSCWTDHSHGTVHVHPRSQILPTNISSKMAQVYFLAHLPMSYYNHERPSSGVC